MTTKPILEETIKCLEDSITSLKKEQAQKQALAQKVKTFELRGETLLPVVQGFRGVYKSKKFELDQTGPYPFSYRATYYWDHAILTCTGNTPEEALKRLDDSLSKSRGPYNKLELNY